MMKSLGPVVRPGVAGRPRIGPEKVTARGRGERGSGGRRENPVSQNGNPQN